MPLIAGHNFEDTSAGRVCACGRRWVSIASASEDDVGRGGIAHTGALNVAELEQIRAEVERMWRAVGDVAGGGR